MPRGWRRQPRSSRSQRRWSNAASSFRDGPKDQTRNLEIPGSLVSLSPRNDGCSSTRADQRQGFIAFEQVKQAAQRFAARALKLRIILHDAQRFVARFRDQLAVHVGARDPIAGQAALSYADHVAFAAQF